MVTAAVEEALVQRLPLVLTRDEPADRRAAVLREGGVASVLAVPAGVGAELLGVLVVERVSPTSWADGVLGLARAIADILAGALARCQAERSARRADDRYRRLLQTSAEGVCLLDADGTICFANPAFVTLVGGGASSLEGTAILRYLGGRDPAGTAARLLHESGRFEIEMQRLDGVHRWVSCSTSALHEDVDGAHALIMLTDISIRRAAEAALRNSEARFRALVRSSSDVIVVTDHTGMIAYVSPSVSEVLGYEAGALQGTSPLALVHPDDLPEVQGKAQALWDARSGSLVVRCRVATADGRYRSMEAALTNLIDDDAVSGITITARDISEQLALQATLTFDATHDPVTGLPNRRVFNDHLASELRSNAEGLALLFADLDGFKAVNDTHGHDTGDELLRLVVARLQRAVRDGDVVVRYGGDEFAVLCPGLTTREGVEAVAARIVGALQAPFRAGGADVRVGVSIGIAVAPPGDREAATGSSRATARALVADADAALYDAKRQGDGWSFSGGADRG